MKIERVRLADDLFKAFEECNVEYVHWKSNAFLHQAISSAEDLDVLVNKRKYCKVVEVLGRLGFKRAEALSSSLHPGTEHYYGFDRDSGRLVHFHCYFSIISGDSLVKNFRMPIESMLLENSRKHLDISIPQAESEYISLILRCALKQSTIVERILFKRDINRIRDEYLWLEKDIELTRVEEILTQYLPFITLEDIKTASKVITNDLSTWHKYQIYRAISDKMSSFKRYNSILFSTHSYRLTFKLVYNRLVKQKGAMKLNSGGAMIALVGPQATGKSTISAFITKWLGNEFSVRVVHTGKPPSTLLTYLPNKALPFARKMFPNKRSSYIETKGNKKDSYSLIHIFRILCLAYDRKSLLLKLHRKVAEGTIVFTDRYPTSIPGAIDSRHFTNDEISNQKSVLKKYLMQLETKIYSQIPEPDCAIQLTVPVEVAIERDLKRDKPGAKDPEYVRRRHAMAVKPRFKCDTITVSTLQDFADTEKKIKDYVWSRI